MGDVTVGSTPNNVEGAMTPVDPTGDLAEVVTRVDRDRVGDTSLYRFSFPPCNLPSSEQDRLIELSGEFGACPVLAAFKLEPPGDWGCCCCCC
jgi:hypothetical protein